MLDVLAILVALTVLGIVAFGMRPLARGEAMIAELERALARTGRPVTDGTTLSAIERRLGSDSGAGAYVRALRLQRFGGSGEQPTAPQRRALRGALSAGLGPLGGSGHCGRFRLAGWLSGAGRITHGVLKLETAMDDVYELFRRGTELLEAGHNHQATIPLSRARDLAPDKTSIREALGRALFGAQRYEQAATEFEAVIDRAPTNDYALFCLGRSLQMLGRHAEARKPLALAACLQPGRRDYRLYRDRARARPRPPRPPRTSAEEAGSRCVRTVLAHRAVGPS